MSAVHRGLRAAARPLRLPRATAPLASGPRFAGLAPLSAAPASALASTSVSRFSTTTRRRSAPAMASPDRKYDPEIEDIADYVANTPIDSELAVSRRPRTGGSARG